MKSILVEILCKKCLYHTHIKSHTLMLPELEPNLRTKILDGQMFSYTCPRCQQIIQYIHPFLYHDKQHQFLIFMSKEEKDMEELQSQFPLTTIRLVREPAQLIEKIRIFEDHLDDRIIELLKFILLKKYPNVASIRYHDYDKKSQSIWLDFIDAEDQIDRKGIDYKFYQGYQVKYADVLKLQRNYEIHQDWAKQKWNS